MMFSWLLTFIQAKVAMVLLVVAAFYAAGLKIEVWNLQSRLKDSLDRLQVCETTKTKLKFQNEGFNTSLDQMEERCKELIRYERNKPKQGPVDDSDVDDAYLNDLFGKLRNRPASEGNSPGPGSAGKDSAPGKAAN